MIQSNNVMNTIRRISMSEHENDKDSYYYLESLVKKVKNVLDTNKLEVISTLRLWINSEDNALRFDGLFLIQSLDLVEMISDLTSTRWALENSSNQEMRRDVEWVDRIISKFIEARRK